MIRILIVEDEALVALNLRKRIEHMGYGVCGATGDGDEAIRLAERDRPDLVLMDIGLKGQTTGTEAADQIANRLGIPVIFSTAHADDQTLAEAGVSAPYGYLVKPVHEVSLKATLEMAVHRIEKDRGREGVERWTLAWVDRAAQPILGLDTHGRVTFANQALCSRLHQKPDGLTLDQLPEMRLCPPTEAKSHTHIRLDELAGKLHPIHGENGSDLGAMVLFGDPAPSGPSATPGKRKKADPENEVVLSEVEKTLPELAYVKAISPYCEIVADWGSREFRVPLHLLEDIPGLVRTHRSYLVNSARVLCSRIVSGGGYELWLRLGQGIEMLPVSRSQLPFLKKTWPAWFS